MDVTTEAKKNNYYLLISVQKDVLLKVTFSGAAPSAVETVDRAYVKANRDKSGFVLVDVRPAAYFDGEKTFVSGATAGHIPGAVNIPLACLNASSDAELSSVGLSKDKTVIVYCNIGGTSASAATVLAGKGYGSIKDYSGGMRDWGSDASETVAMKGVVLDLSGVGTHTISLDVLPEKSVSWAIGDPSIVKLDAAVGPKVEVSAIRAGTTTLLATIDGQAKAETTVTVSGGSSSSGGGCDVGWSPMVLTLLVPLVFATFKR